MAKTQRQLLADAYEQNRILMHRIHQAEQSHLPLRGEIAGLKNDLATASRRATTAEMAASLYRDALLSLIHLVHHLAGGKMTRDDDAHANAVLGALHKTEGSS